MHIPLADQLGDCSCNQEIVIWEPEYPCMRNVVWLRVVSYEQRDRVVPTQSLDLPYIQYREPAVSSKGVTNVLERRAHQT